METKKFMRKPFGVNAAQVTESNMEELAGWCDGAIHNEPKGVYIKVPVNYPMTPRQTKAYVGDWILASDRGFKVYTDKALRANFDETDGEIPSGETSKNVFDEPQELFTTDQPVDEKDAISGKQ